MAEEGHCGALGGWGVLPIRGWGLPPSVLPDISPSRGEIDSWLGIAHLRG
ncbi:hypothetical protein X971_2340 [Agrobacterium tumefaciens LBA4213 (Ach5)]|nr:hypothetical protein X971_2340 [Agrobacterium tumefaciens LBA4213 (Ach5)]